MLPVGTIIQREASIGKGVVSAAGKEYPWEVSKIGTWWDDPDGGVKTQGAEKSWTYQQVLPAGVWRPLVRWTSSPGRFEEARFALLIEGLPRYAVTLDQKTRHLQWVPLEQFELEGETTVVVTLVGTNKTQPDGRKWLVATHGVNFEKIAEVGTVGEPAVPEQPEQPEQPVPEVPGEFDLSALLPPLPANMSQAEMEWQLKTAETWHRFYALESAKAAEELEAERAYREARIAALSAGLDRFIEYVEVYLGRVKAMRERLGIN